VEFGASTGALLRSLHTCSRPEAPSAQFSITRAAFSSPGRTPSRSDGLAAPEVFAPAVPRPSRSGTVRVGTLARRARPLPRWPRHVEEQRRGRGEDLAIQALLADTAPGRHVLHRERTSVAMKASTLTRAGLVQEAIGDLLVQGSDPLTGLGPVARARRLRASSRWRARKLAPERSSGNGGSPRRSGSPASVASVARVSTPQSSPASCWPRQRFGVHATVTEA